MRQEGYPEVWNFFGETNGNDRERMWFRSDVLFQVNSYGSDFAISCMMQINGQ